MPWVFCNSDTVGQRNSDLMRIGSYIASITNMPVTLHRQCIGGTKTQYLIQYRPSTFQFYVSYTTYVDGKARTRTRPFISWIDTLCYMVSNYGGNTVKLAYRKTSDPKERPFYFQTFVGGIIV